MKASAGYYSLIQYCPDPSRAEVVNIGVLLFCPSLNFIDAQINPGNKRIATVFGKNTFDADRIQETKSSIRRRLHIGRNAFKELKDLELYITSLANEIRITGPRSIKVFEPETELGNLFRELVGGRAKPPKEPHEAFRKLHSRMNQSNLRNRVKMDYKVEVHIANRLSVRSLTVDYAYNNGSLNLVKTELFSVGTSGIDKAFKLAGEASLIQKFGGNGNAHKFIVVADISSSPNLVEFRDKIGGVFSGHNIRSVWESEIDQFVDEIVRDAH